MNLGPIIFYGSGGITLHSVIGNNSIIAKKFPYPPDETEINAQKIAASIGISPNIYPTDFLNVIVMDYISGDTLNNYLSKYFLKHKKTISNIQKQVPKKLISDIQKTFEKLYNIGIAHLDKNGNNIIVQPNGNIKIIDFGEVEIYDGPVPLKDRKYIFDVCIGEDKYENCYNIDAFYDEEKEKIRKNRLEKAKRKAMEEQQKRLAKRLAKFSKKS